MFLRRLLIFILMITLASEMAYGISFSDVGSEHKNMTAIYEMAEAGILNGYEDGTFKPDNPVTRAELSVIISRTLGFKKDEEKIDVKLPFDDVYDGYWAIDYIKYAYKTKIINGMGDGTFLPAGKVTYEQAVKMIVCASGFEKEAKDMMDEKWYSGYLKIAERVGILENVTAHIGKSATRSDIVQMMYNSIANEYILLEDKKDDKNPEEENKEPEEEEIIEYIEEEIEVKKIVVDAGHNFDGFDKGARLEDDSIIEEVITWQIADKLKDCLEDLGFEVYMTRKNLKSSIGNESVIESLRARVEMAHDVDADLFISVHCNVGGGTGVETYCYDLQGSGAKLSKEITKSISKATGLYNRGPKESNFYVIKNTAMTAVLIETGFIDNEEDAKILTSDKKQKDMAKAIADAVNKNKIITIKKPVVKEDASKNKKLNVKEAEEENIDDK